MGDVAVEPAQVAFLAQWPWAIFIMEWSHVFLGIFWFGSILYVNFVLIPAVLGLPYQRQREVGERLTRHSVRVIRPVATLVIITGILRGTVWGRIDGPDVLFGTRYGVVWLIALVAAVATFAWGDAMVRPAAMNLYMQDEAWVPGPEGTPLSGTHRWDESPQGPRAPRACWFLRRLHVHDHPAVQLAAIYLRQMSGDSDVLSFSRSGVA